ncbi:MAG: L-2-hydroxyglutarate oxidase, partial [Nonomuraea sp.]|nr:L-2-hydroxyglutarate oxidase [Nonomuraea sp.]
MFDSRRYGGRVALTRKIRGVTEKIGVVGAGIVGLAVARELAAARGAEVTVLEKEARVGAHQTGHNSGVVHAGIYYQPGSLKATLCREGVALLRAYCAEHELPYREVGKLVVASSRAERAALRALAERARANGVPGIAELDALGLREIEPHAVGVAAIHSPHTAIADFPAVARRLALDVAELGGSVRLSHPVRAIRETSRGVQVLAARRRFTFDRLVVCGGLGTDTVAAMAGMPGEVRIVPFRGEYYALAGAARELVRGLIYPVPDPRYPFLGVHLTRHIDDEVLVGPNAVLALAYEGYKWRNIANFGQIMRWPGTLRMARTHWRTGIKE